VIADVTVSPGALAPLPEGTDLVLKATHKNGLEALAKTLLAHGRLIFADGNDAKALVRAVRDLGETSPRSAKAWQEALISLKDYNRLEVAVPNRKPLDASAAAKVLRSEWKGASRVLVISHEQAAEIGVHNCDAKSQPEISPILVARDSATFRRLEDLADSGVWGASETREDFWNRVLRPLARHSKRIDICDRYALSRLVEQRNGVRKSTSDNALTWLLSKIDEEGMPGVTVGIYAGLGESSKVDGRELRGPQSPGEVKTLVEDSLTLGGGRISEVEYRVVFWKGMEFAARPHERHISFSAGADIGLDRGLDGFDTERVQPTAGIAWSYRYGQAARGKNSSERQAIESASGRLAKQKTSQN
jgi:hypothetical protein